MKVLIAGSTGLAGSAISSAFESKGYYVDGINRSKVNLLDFESTLEFITNSGPSILVDAAAKVGGISVNNSMPVDFLYENIQIQNNLMRASHQAGVKKFVFLGSSCIYPRDAFQPIKEESLMTGPLERTNSAYAMAKIAGIEMINSYRRQFNHEWISLMPTNLYGPNDNFNLASSHVLPALIRKFIEAVKNDARQITLWGDGTPRREFLHSQDLAHAVVLAAETYNEELHLNIGTGEDVSIKELADLMAEATGFEGQIIWDSTKPNGTPRKVLDVSRIKAIGWEPSITLKEGIASTIAWYKKVELEEGVRK